MRDIEKAAKKRAEKSMFMEEQKKIAENAQ